MTVHIISAVSTGCLTGHRLTAGLVGVVSRRLGVLGVDDQQRPAGEALEDLELR
jgi:hypothetical protein